MSSLATLPHGRSRHFETPGAAARGGAEVEDPRVRSGAAGSGRRSAGVSDGVSETGGGVPGGILGAHSVRRIRVTNLYD